jgi:hypothetical protein
MDGALVSTLEVRTVELWGTRWETETENQWGQVLELAPLMDGKKLDLKLDLMWDLHSVRASEIHSALMMDEK